MTDPGDSNELDGALHRLFADSAPNPCEPAALVLDRIGPRMVRARRRRIAGQATAAVAITISAVGLGVAALPNQGEPDTIVMADAGGTGDHPGTGSTGSTRPETDESGPTETTSPSTPSTVAQTVTPSTTVPVTEPSTPSTAAPPTSALSPTSSVVTETTTTVAVQPTDLVYSSPGGNITVRWSTSEIALIATDPQPGFVAEVKENGPIEVEVEFTNEATEQSHEIELELEDGSIHRHS
ncbi:MAG: hypothetical protein GY698_06030 [Actinomycetia bacterium]|nr:hypothetical protein [Actinomycetes bacterium]